MRLKKLLNKFRFIKKVTFKSTIKIISIVLFAYLFFASCQQELPQAPGLKSNVFLDTVNIQSEFIDTTIFKTNDDIVADSSKYLYFGSDKNVNTYSLLKFHIPDKLVGEISSLELNITFYKQYIYSQDSTENKNISLNVYHKNEDNWSEKSKYSELDSSVTNSKKTQLVDKEIIENDSTLNIDLEDNIIPQDTVLSILLDTETKNVIQTIYSRHSKSYPTLTIKSKQDTITKSLESDVSSISYTKEARRQYRFFPIDLDGISDEVAIDHVTLTAPLDKVVSYSNRLKIGYIDTDSIAYNPASIDYSKVSRKTVYSEQDSISLNITPIVRRRRANSSNHFQILLWGRKNMFGLGEIYYDRDKQYELKIQTVEHKIPNK